MRMLVNYYPFENSKYFFEADLFHLDDSLFVTHFPFSTLKFQVVIIILCSQIKCWIILKLQNLILVFIILHLLEFGTGYHYDQIK